MMTYTDLRTNRRKFLALTGLTLAEFELLLPAFSRRYEELYLPDRTLAGRPRQRFAGGGRKGVLDSAEQKLLFMLVLSQGLSSASPLGRTLWLESVPGELLDSSPVADSALGLGRLGCSPGARPRPLCEADRRLRRSLG